MAVSEKLRSGLLEFLTAAGPAYATPSLTERMYLLWVFRNFHRLPRQVLSRRQRELVDRLCRNAVLARHAGAGDYVIGVVENVDYVPGRKTEAATGKVVEMPAVTARVALPRAAGSESISLAPPTHTPGRKASPRAERRAAQPNPARHRIAPASRLRARWNILRFRRWAQWTLLALCMAALGWTALHFRHLRPASAAAPLKPPVTAAPLPSSVRVDPPKAPVAPSSPAVAPAHAAPRVAAKLRPLNSAPPKTENPPPAAVVEQPPVTPPATTTRERVAVTAAPVSFAYPKPPNSSAVGKVTLRIVIAADGSVQAVEAASGEGRLAAAAITAARHWRYRPVQANGHAVEAETKATVSFAGDDVVTIRFRD